MDMPLFNNKKQLYLSALETITSTSDRFNKLARGFGMLGASRSRAASARELYAKISDADCSVDLTRANLSTLLIGMQNLDYMYSIDDNVCRLIFGLTKDQLDVYLAEIKAGTHGKRALKRFYTSAPDPEMM